MAFGVAQRAASREKSRKKVEKSQKSKNQKVGVPAKVECSGKRLMMVC
jgi:hypothetical protein